MRALWWCLLLGVFPGLASAAMPAPKIEKINDHVYALLGPVGLPDKKNDGYMVNSTVIVGDVGVILIDTGFTDEIGKHLAKAIATITPKPVTHIINTHHHGDHTLGNIAFPGVQVISAEQCKKLVMTTGYDWIGIIQNVLDKKFPNTKPVPATVTIADGGDVEQVINGIKLRMIVPQGSHTPGDLLVYLPDDKLLVAGDILVQHMAPSFRDAHVKHWIESLAEIEKMDVKNIVPGHGPLMNLAGVKAMRERMVALYAAVEAGYKKGLTDSEIRKTLDLREWIQMVNYDELMGGNINRTYLEVEQDNF